MIMIITKSWIIKITLIIILIIIFIIITIIKIIIKIMKMMMTMMTIKQRSYEPAKQSTKVKLSEQCNHCIQLLAHTETTFIIFGIGINADSIREALH